jgi:hypothetical protein
MTSLTSYESLLEAAKNNPESADFKALRLAQTTLPTYDPYTTKGTWHAEVMHAMEHEAFTHALETIEGRLAENYLDAEFHILAAQAYGRLGEPDKAAYHQMWFMGLLGSMLSPNAGRSFETAIPVISLDEEYAVLGALGGQMERQSKIEQDGHHYDLLLVRLKGQRITLYFDIDIPFAWLTDHYPKS